MSLTRRPIFRERSGLRRWWRFESFSLFLGRQLLERGLGREVLGHGAAEAPDGLADFPTNSFVLFLGRFFAADRFALQRLLGLRGAKLVHGQLGTAGAIEELFVLRDALTRFDIFEAHAVEAEVPRVCEERVLLDTGLLGGGVEVFRGLCEALAESEPLINVCEQVVFVVGDLLAASLDCEVGSASAL